MRSGIEEDEGSRWSTTIFWRVLLSSLEPHEINLTPLQKYSRTLYTSFLCSPGRLWKVLHTNTKYKAVLSVPRIGYFLLDYSLGLGIIRCEAENEAHPSPRISFLLFNQKVRYSRNRSTMLDNTDDPSSSFSSVFPWLCLPHIRMRGFPDGCTQVACCTASELCCMAAGRNAGIVGRRTLAGELRVDWH